MRFTALSFVTLFISATGCEPVQPGLSGGPAPIDGEWRLRVMSVDSMGRCGMLRDSDLEGLVMGMDVATRDDWGIRLDIEGMELKGNMDSGQIYAQGHLIDEQGVSIGSEGRDVPEDLDMDESDQGAASDPVYSDIEPPVEDKPVRDGGVHTELVANTVTRSRMEGELTIEYEQSNSECVLILDFEAFHMDSGVDDKEPMIDVPKPSKPEVGEEEDIVVEI